MQVESIKNQVFSQSHDLCSENILLKNARDGKLQHQELASYFFNLKHVLEQTPRNLRRAADRARQMELPQIERFMIEKIAEETGHDRWAEDDLEKLPESSRIALEVHAETRQLVEYIDELIEEDPRLYLIYILFVENFTVVAAPSFLTDLKQNLGVEESAASVVSNHEKADRDHVLEDLKEVASFPEDHHFVARVQEVLKESRHFVNQALNSCVNH